MIEDFKLWIQTYDQFYLFSITFVFCPHFLYDYTVCKKSHSPPRLEWIVQWLDSCL